MSYLLYNIPFFLLLAALLGFVIGWLLRGNRFQSELQDLDSRWRSKLSEVESERDRFAADVTQANEARAKHEAKLEQLRREHQSKLEALGDAEKRVGGLESQLADAKASLTKRQGNGADAQRLGKDLAAATDRAESLERDLQQAKEANSACKREVERLQARIADLQHASASTGDSGGALGLVGSGVSTAESGSVPSPASGGGASGSSSRTTGASVTVGASGGATSPGSGTPLGLVGGRDIQGGTGGASDRGQPGDRQGPSGSSGGGQDDEGERPEALQEARGGVADDLKKISGVGPKLEKTLNGLGIFHFAQIAAFTPSNVAWVDRHLRFKGRIEREKWIEQARVLAAGGET